jgi:hypothetical protein
LHIENEISMYSYTCDEIILKNIGKPQNKGKSVLGEGAEGVWTNRSHLGIHEN